MPLRNQFQAKEGSFLEILTLNLESFRGGWVDESGSASHRISTTSTYDTTGRRNPNAIGRDRRDEKLATISNNNMLDVVEYDLDFIMGRFDSIDPKSIKPIEDMDANIGDTIIFETKEKSLYGGIFPGGYLIRNNIPRAVEIGNFSPRDLKNGKIRRPGIIPKNWPMPRINQKTMELPLGALTGRYIILRAYNAPFEGQLGYNSWVIPTPVPRG